MLVELGIALFSVLGCPFVGHVCRPDPAHVRTIIALQTPERHDMCPPWQLCLLARRETDPNDCVCCFGVRPRAAHTKYDWDSWQFERKCSAALRSGHREKFLVWQCIGRTYRSVHIWPETRSNGSGSTNGAKRTPQISPEINSNAVSWRFSGPPSAGERNSFDPRLPE